MSPPRRVGEVVGGHGVALCAVTTEVVRGNTHVGQAMFTRSSDPCAHGVARAARASYGRYVMFVTRQAAMPNIQAMRRRASIRLGMKKYVRCASTRGAMLRGVERRSCRMSVIRLRHVVANDNAARHNVV